VSCGHPARGGRAGCPPGGPDRALPAPCLGGQGRLIQVFRPWARFGSACGQHAVSSRPCQHGVALPARADRMPWIQLHSMRRRTQHRGSVCRGAARLFSFSTVRRQGAVGGVPGQQGGWHARATGEAAGTPPGRLQGLYVPVPQGAQHGCRDSQPGGAVGAGTQAVPGPRAGIACCLPAAG
jgi:hypothetical protein